MNDTESLICNIKCIDIWCTIYYNTVTVLSVIVHLTINILGEYYGGENLIQIDNNNPKAIYEQVYDEIAKLILSKVLKPDEKLPSVRELAAMLKINPNTIQKSYKSLEENNYIYTVKGKGNFVKNSEELRSIYLNNMKEKLGEAIKSLKNLGLDDEYIMELVKNVLNPMDDEGGSNVKG